MDVEGEGQFDWSFEILLQIDINDRSNRRMS